MNPLGLDIKTVAHHHPVTVKRRTDIAALASESHRGPHTFRPFRNGNTANAVRIGERGLCGVRVLAEGPRSHRGSACAGAAGHGADGRPADTKRLPHSRGVREPLVITRGDYR